jgi:hypothetical protein
VEAVSEGAIKSYDVPVLAICSFRFTSVARLGVWGLAPIKNDIMLAALAPGNDTIRHEHEDKVQCLV